MFKNLKLKNRIILGYTVPLVFSISTAALVYGNVEKVYQQNNKQTLGYEIVRNTDRIALSLARLQRAARGYIIETEADSLNDFQDAESLFEKSAKYLQENVVIAEQKQRLDKILQLGRQSLEFNKNLIALVKAGRVREANREYSSSDRQILNQKIQQVLDEFQQTENLIQAEKDRETTEALKFLTMMVVLGTLMSISLAIPIGLWIASRITQTINESISAIASSSTEIATTVEEQERTASQQATAVHQTTTTMDELGVSSRQSAEKAEISAQGAQIALKKAEEGTLAVDQTLEAMAKLKESVDAIAKQILNLSHQTNQIGNISTLVSDLANQTNMLALNAAVEAVRAGENGKGFGIVASEIRKLADASKKAAEKINLLVKDIENAINSTVIVTDEGTKTAEHGELISQKTATAFNDIVQAIDSVFESSQQISLNVKQQAVAIQQVVATMNSLNAIAVETASGISQAKVGTQKLNEVALNLKTMV